MQYIKYYFLFFWFINFSLFSFNELVENINKNNIENIKLFLDTTGENNLKNIFKTKEKISGNTPMLIAANKNYLNIVKLFLDKQEQIGININESNKNNDTLLHIICRNNTCKVVKNNSIDEIYIPKSYRLEPGANGFDPIPLLRESHYPLYEMDWKLQPHTQFKNQLDSIFNT